MVTVVLFNNAVAQSGIGLEQYFYFGKSQDVSLVTIGYYQSAHNWYGEVRYNYEERKTMSLYAGKTFYGGKKLSYTVTPMLGVLVGQYNGGSVGTNLDVSYKNFDLLSQVQYIFSKNDRSRNFILNWSELSYQILSFLKSGMVLQQSTVYQSPLKVEAGAFIGLSYKNWELPVYVFSPFSKDRNYVIGISYAWQQGSRSNNHGPAPSLKARKKVAVE